MDQGHDSASRIPGPSTTWCVRLVVGTPGLGYNLAEHCVVIGAALLDLPPVLHGPCSTGSPVPLKRQLVFVLHLQLHCTYCMWRCYMVA